MNAVRVRRQILLAACSLAVTTFVAMLTPGQPLVARASLGTAYASLLLLGASLIIGPLRVIRGQPNPPSNNVRREIGIWAAIVGIVHVALGLQVHLRGNMLAYFFTNPGRLTVRFDLFGLANDTGLLATLLLLLLLSLSNNISLRALKADRWKGLQRWNYAAALLVAIHGVVYQVIERRTLGFAGLLAIVVAAVAGAQADGFAQRARLQRQIGS